MRTPIHQRCAAKIDIFFTRISYGLPSVRSAAGAIFMPPPKNRPLCRETFVIRPRCTRCTGAFLASCTSGKVELKGASHGMAHLAGTRGIIITNNVPASEFPASKTSKKLTAIATHS